MMNPEISLSLIKKEEILVKQEPKTLQTPLQSPKQTQPNQETISNPNQHKKETQSKVKLESEQGQNNIPDKELQPPSNISSDNNLLSDQNREKNFQFQQNNGNISGKHETPKNSNPTLPKKKDIDQSQSISLFTKSMIQKIGLEQNPHLQYSKTIEPSQNQQQQFNNIHQKASNNQNVRLKQKNIQSYQHNNTNNNLNMAHPQYPKQMTPSDLELFHRLDSEKKQSNFEISKLQNIQLETEQKKKKIQDDIQYHRSQINIHKQMQLFHEKKLQQQESQLKSLQSKSIKIQQSCFLKQDQNKQIEQQLYNLQNNIQQQSNSISQNPQNQNYYQSMQQQQYDQFGHESNPNQTEDSQNFQTENKTSLRNFVHQINDKLKYQQSDVQDSNKSENPFPSQQQFPSSTSQNNLFSHNNLPEENKIHSAEQVLNLSPEKRLQRYISSSSENQKKQGKIKQKTLKKYQFQESLIQEQAKQQYIQEQLNILKNKSNLNHLKDESNDNNNNTHNNNNSQISEEVEQEIDLSQYKGRERLKKIMRKFPKPYDWKFIKKKDFCDLMNISDHEEYKQQMTQTIKSDESFIYKTKNVIKGLLSKFARALEIEQQSIIEQIRFLPIKEENDIYNVMELIQDEAYKQYQKIILSVKNTFELQAIFQHYPLFNSANLKQISKWKKKIQEQVQDENNQLHIKDERCYLQRVFEQAGGIIRQIYPESKTDLSLISKSSALLAEFNIYVEKLNFFNYINRVAMFRFCQMQFPVDNYSSSKIRDQQSYNYFCLSLLFGKLQEVENLSSVR